MLRKVLIVASIIVIIFLIILGVLYFLTRSAPSPDESIIIQTARNLFPFGQPVRNPDDLFPSGGDVSETGDQGQMINPGELPIPRLREISDKPTAGSVFWLETKPQTKEKILHIRFADRATGHILETASDSLETQNLSNTTLPKMYEAKFAGPNSFLARFLDESDTDTIKTYFLSLKDKITKQVATTTASSTPLILDTPKESIGTALENNIKEISLSPSKSKILYSLYENDGGSLIIANPNGTGKRKIYSGPLREWLLNWITDSTALISTKPSGFADGAAYTLNTVTGAIKKIIGSARGLTVLPKPGSSTTFLVGEASENLTLSVFKTDAPASSNRVYLPKTFPEKCVWSKKDSVIIYCAVPVAFPQAVYPDDWYQGKISFTDHIWKINSVTSQTSLVVTPEENTSESMDITNLEVSDDETYLTFINKKDLSLWGYQLIVPPLKTATSTAAANLSTVATTTASTTVR